MSLNEGTYGLYLEPRSWSYSCELKYDAQTGTFLTKPCLTIEAAPAKAEGRDARVVLPSGRSLDVLPVTLYIYVGRTPETEMELAAEQIQFINPYGSRTPFKTHLGWFSYFKDEKGEATYIELMLEERIFADIASCARSPSQRLTHVNLGLFGQGLVQERSFTSTVYRWDGEGQLRVGSLHYRIDPTRA